MPDLLTLLLAAVIAMVAIALITFLVRRRRAAQDAAIVAASTPVTELSEDDIAWRIGVAGVDRPEGDAAAEGFAAAELAAAELAAFDLAEAETGEAIEPAPVPVAVAVATPPRRRATSAPISRRYRLWRDSAAVLLVATIALLAVTTVPGFLPATAEESSSPTEVAIVETETPTEEPAEEPSQPPTTAPPTPAPVIPAVPTETPTAAPTTPKPTAGSTPRPTARPTPRPTPPSTPISTPRATASPTASPMETPPPTPSPPPAAPAVVAVASCTSGHTINFSFSNSGGPISTITWDMQDGSRSELDSGSHTYSSDGDYLVVVTVSGPGGDASDGETVTVPCP